MPNDAKIVKQESGVRFHSLTSVIKKEQAQPLEEFSTENNLWIKDLPGEDRFLVRGEKLEFNSILLHNLIFPNTTYTIEGFIKEEEVLYAVMKQPFITSDGQADLDNVKKLLAYNGFENTR